MSARISTAVRLELREQRRRPLVVVLLAVVPVLFITRSIGRTSPIPRRISLPGGGHLVTTMREIHGVTMAAVTVAFLGALCGAFIATAARQADGRLVVAGFRPHEAIVPRLTVLALATGFVAAVSIAVTAVSFSPASWMAFAVGTVLVGLTYGCIGAVAGALVGPLGATYLALFAAMIGQGILQSPMFGSGESAGAATWLPDHAATRIVIAGGFSTGFHAWPELGAALAWLVVLTGVTAIVLARQLRVH